MAFLCYMSVRLTKWNYCEIMERGHGLQMVSTFLHEPHSTYIKSASKSTSKYACVALNTSRLEEVSLYNYFVLNSGAVRKGWPVAMHFKKMRGGRGGEWHHIAIEKRQVPLLNSYRCISEVRISNSHTHGQKVFLSAGKRLAVTFPSIYGRKCNSRQATGSKNVEPLFASRKEQYILLFSKASGQVLGHTRPHIWRAFSKEVRRPGREGDHTAPCKNTYGYVSTPPYGFIIFTLFTFMFARIFITEHYKFKRLLVPL